MTEKSAVIVVVEGYSDMASIGTILKEYFCSTETQFVITRGDITSRDGVTPANVITKLKTEIDTVRTKYGYQWKDLIRIIHIADTDGTFTKDCVVKADVKSIQYYEDHMESANVEVTQQEMRIKPRSCLSYLPPIKLTVPITGFTLILVTWNMSCIML